MGFPGDLGRRDRGLCACVCLECVCMGFGSSLCIVFCVSVGSSCCHGGCPIYSSFVAFFASFFFCEVPVVVASLAAFSAPQRFQLPSRGRRVGCPVTTATAAKRSSPKRARPRDRHMAELGESREEGGQGGREWRKKTPNEGGDDPGRARRRPAPLPSRAQRWPRSGAQVQPSTDRRAPPVGGVAPRPPREKARLGPQRAPPAAA